MVNIFPTTKLGKWSVGLIINFGIFLGLFIYIVSLGYRGGDTFFSQPALATPIIIAGASGVASFITGIVSIIKHTKRSILVLVSTTLGFLVTLFMLGEILSPH
jgi:site-specific recombinase